MHYQLNKVIVMVLGLCIFNVQANEKYSDFKPLFNGKNFDGLYLKLRSGDEEMAKKVFAIENETIHVFNDEFPQEYNLNTGANDTHGLFYTKKKYSKYILRFDYKWGTKIANNFKQWQYDAGVYYHVTKDNVWPTGIEYQIRYDHRTDKNNTGDLIRSGKGIDYLLYTDPSSQEKKKTFLHPNEGGVASTVKGWWHLAKDTRNFNALNDKWNHSEIIVMGNEYTIHKLNGEIINMATNLTPSTGIIGFQSETAEIFYRNIEIKEIDESIPMAEFLK
ncbi:DUF1080 domain-containing protein [Paraglaciecola sp. L3A3]|uniref:3-keto-disaccharide hydrolase n=1 Tax=Paraglaciecola sp. L3A3 TaxID=2686358 RepID=UPI00131B86A5|nr:DUF1080 domain-containing protein [Paraglaciecola sp. L3A3]